MHISENLEKFINIGKEELFLREKIAIILSNYFKINFRKEDILLKNNILKIKTSSSIKNNIFIKKEELLFVFKKELPNVTITDLL